MGIWGTRLTEWHLCSSFKFCQRLSLNHLRIKTFSIFLRKTLLRWSLLGDTNDTGGIQISEAIAPPPSYGQLFVIFLAVQNSSKLFCPLIALTPQTIRVFTTLQSDSSDFWSEGWGDMAWPKNTYLPTYLPCTYLSSYRHLWPLRHLIRVMRRHDLTKNIYLPTYIPVQYLPVQLFAYLPPSENNLNSW